MNRNKPLRADPDKTRAWQRRSRKPLAAKSAKRAAKRPAEREVTEIVYGRDGGCVLRSMPRLGDEVPLCGGPLTPHHLSKQSKGYDWSEDNLVALCSTHNGWVEDEPDLARTLGLVVTWGLDHAEARRRRIAAGLVCW
jgi:hypothetical protein